MAFHVGQKVCCISQGQWKTVHGPNRPKVLNPKKGDVFTVDGIYDIAGMVALTFVEGDDSQAFNSIHFRPVQEQGMSILRAILADPKVKIKETA